MRHRHHSNESAVVKNCLIIDPRTKNVGGVEAVLLKILEVLIEQKQDLYFISKLPSGGMFDNLPLSKIKQLCYNYEVEESRRFQVYRTLCLRSKLQGMLRKEVGEIALEFNTRDPLYSLGVGKKRVSYVHFPELLFALQSVRKHRWFWKMYYWPINFQLKRQIKKHDLIMCNSYYTKKAILEFWRGAKVEVVYPPVGTKIFRPLQKESLVVSVGRCSPEKNFEMIIQVARQMPQVKFVIACSKRLNDPYYDKIVALKPDNMEIQTDISQTDLSCLLGKAKVYLHGMVNEHFGISVAEAMAAGCVPVVHNSGGPVEIVGDYGFLYNSVEECISATENALQSKMEISDIVNQVKKFDADHFKKNVIDALEKIILEPV